VAEKTVPNNSSPTGQEASMASNSYGDISANLQGLRPSGASKYRLRQFSANAVS